MKILKIAFRNLNSLTGDHEIDLSSGPLYRAGIFAITGPTGAGKSTILDALTLALYGRAARYGDERRPEFMMSRTAGDCHAEVEFEVTAGRFRATWHMRRARGKSNGNIQTPTRRLYDAAGLSQAEKINDVNQKIEELIGLDAERFLRSVLLAQNEFTRFLKASANERAMLLESLTGTAIYSRLSQKCHEVYGQRKNDLELRQSRLEQYQLLTDDQLDQANSSLKAEQLASKQFVQQLAKLARVEVSGKDAVRLQTSLEELRVHASQLQARIAASLPDDLRLQRHALAADFRPELQSLQAAAAEAQKLASDALVASDSANQTAIRFRSAISASLEKADAERTLVAGRLELLSQQSSTLNREIAETSNWLVSHGRDGNLGEALPGIAAKISGLKYSRTEIDRLQNEILVHQASLESGRQDAGKNDTELASLTDRLAVLQSEKQNLEKQIAEIAGGQSLEQIETALASATRRIDAVTLLSRDFDSYGEQQLQLAVLRKSSDGLAPQIGSALAKRNHTQERIGDKQKHAETLQHLVDHARLTAELHEHREHLIDGEPCPLCGATEHPLAGKDPEQTRSALREHTNQLLETKTEIKQLDALLKQQNTDFEAVSKRASDFRVQADQLAEQLKTAGQRMEQSAITLGVSPLSAELFESAIGDCNSRVQSLQSTRSRLKSVMNDMTVVGIAVTDGAHARDLLLQKRDVLTKGNADLNDKIGDCETRLAATRESNGHAATLLASDLESWGLGTTDRVADPDASLDELTVRVRDWKKAAQKMEALNARLRELGKEQESDVRHSEAVKSHTGSFQSLRNLPGLYPGDETQPETDPVQVATFVGSWTDLNAAAGELTDLRLAWETARADQKTLQRQASEKGSLRDGVHQELVSRLATTPFSGLTDLQQALLDSETLRKLEAVKKELDNSISRNSHEIVMKSSDLNQLLADGAPVGDALIECRATIRRLQGEQEASGKRIAALDHSLKTDQENRTAQAAGREQLLRDTAQLQSWRRMHQLIGSHDGKKFRLFAQGLSLDLLIQLANRHLHSLFDRYRLQRKPGETLDMEICDLHQANTTRPMNSLSGGESFLASLALALGLSDLAGRNVRIDSLFIDEGFGSLDHDTLDVAVAALESLQARNKTIGLISHVELLKERIPAQIRVVPQSGGESRLEVVG